MFGPHMDLQLFLACECVPTAYLADSFFALFSPTLPFLALGSFLGCLCASDLGQTALCQLLFNYLSVECNEGMARPAQEVQPF